MQSQQTINQQTSNQVFSNSQSYGYSTQNQPINYVNQNGTGYIQQQRIETVNHGPINMTTTTPAKPNLIN